MAALVLIALLGLSLVAVIGNCGSHFSGFFFCRAKVLGSRASVVTARGFGNGDSLTLEHLGSFVVTHWLSCSEACGIFPEKEWNPVPCISRGILNHQSIKEPLYIVYYVVHLL